MSSLSVTKDQTTSAGRLKNMGWWMLLLISILYSAYAFYMAGVEIAFRLGLTGEAPYLGVPIIFIIHAIAGGIVLVSGTLQFNQTILRQYRVIHRLLGRVYVVTIWFSSIGALWLTIYFDVSLIAKLLFIVLAFLWFGTTTLAFMKARNRKIKEHRAWMIRSFALSLFFMTFSFWVDGLAMLPISEAIAYPLAVFLSWSLNLLVAEWWIRGAKMPDFIMAD